MKSKKVKELMNWLEKRTRGIDLPRDYSEGEVFALIEIAELESEESKELDLKVQEFKNKH